MAATIALLFLSGCILPNVVVPQSGAADNGLELQVVPTFTPTPEFLATVLAQNSSNTSSDNSDTVSSTQGIAAEITAIGGTSQETALIDAAGFDFAEQRTIKVYQEHSQAVVNITTQVLRRSFFFDVVPEEGAGSGFVLDTDGHIITNYHVIQGAQRIEVSFSNESILPAQVVGQDRRNDVAILRVDAPPGLLKPVVLGSSANLQVGQRAIAIGNPFGQFGRTLTTGVLSALERTLEGPDGRVITGIIQTDAAINRGNSGGPLLDSSGRVIGVNTAIFSPSGANAGVGFAVPIDTVKRLLPDLLLLGRYRHPWLGIRYAYNITPGLAESLKLPVSNGLILVQLYSRGPLAQVGLQGAQQESILGNRLIYTGGDILTEIDGFSFDSLETLEAYLEDNYQVGDSVSLTFYRGLVREEVDVQLMEEP
ncbi:MAG: trypsin-like peptidase domain-containing protein [Chloroflexota bacterium]